MRREAIERWAFAAVVLCALVVVLLRTNASGHMLDTILVRMEIGAIPRGRIGESWRIADGSTHTFTMEQGQTEEWDHLIATFRARLADEKRAFPPLKD